MWQALRGFSALRGRRVRRIVGRENGGNDAETGLGD